MEAHDPMEDRDDATIRDATQRHLLTSDEVAELLRTTRKGVYAMVARRLLPGVIRVGRRVLVDHGTLLDWLDQKRTPS